MRRVVVHIDSVVLKGFRSGDSHAIAEGLQEQLTNLLSAAGMAQQLTHIQNVPQLRAGSIDIAADAKPRQIGMAIANRLGKEIGP